MVIRNWRNVTPVVGHESKLIWSIFRAQSAEGREENEAVLLGFSGLTLHRLQGGLDGDYHEHEATEQVYYFLSGQGQMKIDGEIYEVREGDAVHIPPKVKHQISNTGGRLDRALDHQRPSRRVDVASNSPAHGRRHGR